MNQETYINEHNAAQILGVSLSTVRLWRRHNKNLHYYKVGRLVRYKLADVEEFKDTRVPPRAGRRPLVRPAQTPPSLNRSAPLDQVALYDNARGEVDIVIRQLLEISKRALVASKILNEMAEEGKRRRD